MDTNTFTTITWPDEAPTPPSVTRRRPKKVHKCSFCDKCFTRHEHCARHERGHTRQRPYSCRYCDRCYARKDLVTRHEKSLHADSYCAQSQASGRRKPTLPLGGSTDQQASLTFNTIGGAQEAGIHGARSPNLSNIPDLDMPPPFTDVDVSESSTGATSEYNRGKPSQRIYDLEPDGNTVPQSFDNFDIFADMPIAEFEHLRSPLVSNDLLIFAGASSNGKRSSDNTNTGFSPSIYSQPGVEASLDSSTGAPQSHLTSGQGLSITELGRDIMLGEVELELGSNHGEKLRLPSANLLNRFLSTYLMCFDQHYPIIHTPSMSIDMSPGPLVLAICGIGALYCLDRKNAIYLQQLVDQWLSKTTETADNVDGLPTLPVWALQTKFLLAFARLFSGNSTAVKSAFGTLDQVTMEYNLRKTALEPLPISLDSLSWDAWIERETLRRLLYSIIMLNNLVTVTYGTFPRLTIIADSELEMPADDVLWEATTEEQWQSAMLSYIFMSPQTIQQVLLNTQTEAQISHISRRSTFAATVIMHAAHSIVGQLRGYSKSLDNFRTDRSTVNMTHERMEKQTKSVLSRCGRLFAGQDSEQEHNLTKPGASRRSNGFALLRVAYNEIATATKPLNRMVLFYTDEEEIAKQVRLYMLGDQEHSVFVTITADMALDGLLTAVKSGPILAMKTACLTWSIDHAIADWDCALFVARWIYSIECSQHDYSAEELRVFGKLRDLLNDADVSYTEEMSLAAEVIKLWANFFDDTWVWGVTPRMAAVMRIIATFCKSQWQAHKAAPTS